jgi:hypothetical protein
LPYAPHLPLGYIAFKGIEVFSVESIEKWDLWVDKVEIMER